MVMQSEDNKGLRRLINALRWTVRGFRSTYKHEEAFRQEVWLSLVMIPLGLWLGENGVERARRGVRRCVFVRVSVDRSEFLSEDETSLLKERLKNFLVSRSPVNTRFRIEITAR